MLGKCWHSLLSCSRSVLKTNKYSRIVDLVVVCSVFFFSFLLMGFQGELGLLIG
jgi:hypothetical protein